MICGVRRRSAAAATALSLVLLASSPLLGCSAAFSSARRPSSASSAAPAVPLRPPASAVIADVSSDTDVAVEAPRRAFLRSAAAAIGASMCGVGDPAFALVKGNAPPPKKKEAGERKCTNVEECQEMAERLAAQQEEELRSSLASNPPKVAPGGSRYRDMDDSSENNEDSSSAAKSGDTVSISYKVLKLGKRSYDGLSGEGTVVFSRGYGLEDDETKPGDKTFDFTLGDPTIIDALNDAVPGMKAGGTRRISVLPQMGWRKPGRECDGGPGGTGAGGDLKTDYVVVPTATMVAEEACFDTQRRPFPKAYAQQRRMAQRFDQSLIVEVTLEGIR